MSKSKVGVKVVKGNINLALRQFKRKVKESEHLDELKERKEYIKPSVKKRKAKLTAIRYHQKEVNIQKELDKKFKI